ncbi:hypothetical protein SLA2020_296710 [Shorea laevis]
MLIALEMIDTITRFKWVMVRDSVFKSSSVATEKKVEEEEDECRSTSGTTSSSSIERIVTRTMMVMCLEDHQMEEIARKMRYKVRTKIPWI